MKTRIIRAIGNFMLGVIAVSIWYGCETMTTNHQICVVFGDTREITDTIYLHDNGRHVDIIIQAQGEYVGYGWGSKTFYLKVPTWDDLTFRAIFNAVDKKNETLMHVKGNLVKKQDWIAIPVTKKQWNSLYQNIEASFDTDINDVWQYVADGYGSNDTFFKANGEYGLNYTCNTWTNEMLKNSGMYARKHALFSKEIINLYK
jgi:hypothetical protein